MKSSFLLAIALLEAPPEEAPEEVMVARIQAEAFQRSELMATVSELSDRFGPRLAGSPEFAEAARWCRDRLIEMGLERVELERFEQEGPAWSLQSFSVEMIEPRYMRLIASPQAWSPGLDAELSGTPRRAEVRSPEDFDAYRGKLRGAIILNGRPEPEEPAPDLPSGRYSDEELERRARQIDPAAKGFGPFTPSSYRAEREAGRASRERRRKILEFFEGEGVAAVITPNRVSGLVVHADDGTGRLSPTRYPRFVLALEHYGRLWRLVERSVPVTLRVDLKSRFHPEAFGANVVGDIPGSDPELSDELVMMGAHLDSVLTGTGAIDDAAGVAVMIEAARILKAIEARPRRTIRIALWGAEEIGHLGSQAHVRAHFGDFETLALLPDPARLSAYFNLDNGGARIRGVYLQGNEAVRPIFQEYLEPFHRLGASTLTILNTGSTDHMPFDALGLPAFQFIQDALDYETRVYHSTLDLYEAVVDEDLRQAAAIVASFVYRTAMRDEMLPRKPAPVP